MSRRTTILFLCALCVLSVQVVAAALATAVATSIADGAEQQPLPISSSGCALLAPYALITAGAARISGAHINGSVAVGGVAVGPALPTGDDLVAAASVSARAICNELPARCTTTVTRGRASGVVITLTARGTTNDVQCVVGAADLERARTVRLVGTAPAALFVILSGRGAEEGAGGWRRSPGRLRLDRLRVEGVAPTRTLWVPCGVDMLRLRRVALVGGLLAPAVDVRADRSSVRGAVIAQSLVARRAALGGARFDCDVVVPGRVT